MHDWHCGTGDRIVSVSLLSVAGNAYNIPEGLIFSFPCVSKNHEWEIVNVPVDPDMLGDIQLTIDDLMAEKELAF